MRPVQALCLSAMVLAGFVLIASRGFSQPAPAGAPPATQAASSAASQTAPAAPPTWAELHGFLTDARKATSLVEGDVPAFHVKATYKLYDADGKPGEAGTFELNQASGTKFVETFKAPHYARATFATDRPDRAVFISGADGSSPPYPLALLRGAFVAPLPAESALAAVGGLGRQERDGPFGKMACIVLFNRPDAATQAAAPPMAGYCFERDTKVLRFASIPFTGTGTAIIRPRIVGFQGRSVAGDIVISRNGKPLLMAHLDTIEAVNAMDEALFVPPADAKLYPTMMAPPGVVPPPFFGVAGMSMPAGPGGTKDANAAGSSGVPKKVYISGAITEGMLLSSTPPVYPPIAKAGRIQGTVVLHGTIGKDGSVEALNVTSGPALLQQAALDAAKTWKYKPFLLNGEPVQVETTFNLIFTLGP